MKFIIHKINIKFLIIYYIYISIGSLLNAQEKSYLAPDVNIISVTPVQGSGMDMDRVPGKIQTIDLEKLAKKRIFQLRKPLIEKLQEFLYLT